MKSQDPAPSIREEFPHWSHAFTKEVKICVHSKFSSAFDISVGFEKLFNGSTQSQRLQILLIALGVHQMTVLCGLI
jgi:hypothetical protein